MSDLMVHALNAAELEDLRTRHPAQRTDIFLAFNPSFSDNVAFDDTVYELRVNQVFASYDMIYEVIYDRDGLGAGVAADFANCLADMTVFVGSTRGAYDVGIVRLRGFAGGSTEDAGTMEIGEESEIEWADNLWLTIVEDFGLWPKHVYIDPATEVIYMDRDVVYTDQHEFPDPVPVMGPDRVVYDADTAISAANTVTVLFDGSDSWALDGGAITYLWAAPGASATAGLATATPSITYNAPGRYTVSCTSTRDYGGGNVSTFTGYRRVYIFDVDNPPTDSFELLSCGGQWDAGGWTFKVRMWDEARRTEIVDRAKVILFARDWFDNVETSVGPIESSTHGILAANIIAIGWISGESIVFDNERGYVEFDIQGPQYWFDRMTGFPHGIEDYLYAPLDWFQFEDLTVDKGLWSFLHWRTTATRMMDYYLTGDTRQIKEFADPLETLWQQITRASEDTILAHPCCDRYARLYVEIPVNVLFLADRAAIPIVMDIDRQDWREEIGIERRIVGEWSMLDLSGTGYQDEAVDPYFSLAHGHIFGRYGDVQRLERLALYRVQATNNTLAGLVIDAANNDYPNVDVRFAGNYRVIDIGPHQYVRMSILETDTERGIVWTDKKFIPHSVSITYDNENGVLMTDAALHAETLGVATVTDGDPPPETPPLPDPDPPPDPLEPEPEVWDGPIQMAVAWNSRQIGFTLDFLRHHVISEATAGTGGGGGLDLYDANVNFNDLEVDTGDVVQNHTDGAGISITTVADHHPEDPHYLELAADILLDPTDEYSIQGLQWSDATGAIDTSQLGNHEVIIHAELVRTGSDTVGAWVVTEIDDGVGWPAGRVVGGNVYNTTNILTASPAWVNRLSLATVRGAGGMNIADAEFRGIAVSAVDPDVAVVSVTSRNALLAGTGLGLCVTADYGGTWAYPATFAPVGDFYYNNAPYQGMDVDDGANVLYMLRGQRDGSRGLWIWASNMPPGAGSSARSTARGTDFEHWTRHYGLYRPFGSGDLYFQGDNPINASWEKSSDGGNSWAGLTAAGYGSVDTAGGFGGWFGNSQYIVTMGIEIAAPNNRVLLRSDDGGGTFTEIGDADVLFLWLDWLLLSPAMTAYTWQPDDQVFVWVGLCQNQAAHSNPRIYYTPDNGAHWCNMMGNWYSIPSFDWNGDGDEQWTGATQHIEIAPPNAGRTGNVGMLLLPRIGVNE